VTDDNSPCHCDDQLTILVYIDIHYVKMYIQSSLEHITDLGNILY